MRDIRQGNRKGNETVQGEKKERDEITCGRVGCESRKVDHARLCQNVFHLLSYKETET